MQTFGFVKIESAVIGQRNIHIKQAEIETGAAGDDRTFTAAGSITGTKRQNA